MAKLTSLERVNIVLSEKGLNQSKLAVKIRVSPATISKALAVDSISGSLAGKIKYCFPEYSIAWLRYGIGSKYDQGYTGMVEEPVSPYGQHSAGKLIMLEGKVLQLEATLQMLLEDMEELILKLKQKGEQTDIDVTKYNRFKH